MIRGIQFTPGSDTDHERGLLAFVRLEYGPLALDGLTLRRTRAGRLTLSWPMRRDRKGNEHPLVRPVSDAARLELEEAVIKELGRQERVE